MVIAIRTLLKEDGGGSGVFGVDNVAAPLNDVHRLEAVEHGLDLVDHGQQPLLDGEVERDVVAPGAEGADVHTIVPGAAIDRLYHAIGHGTVGAVRRYQRQG